MYNLKCYSADILLLSCQRLKVKKARLNWSFWEIIKGQWHSWHDTWDTLWSQNGTLGQVQLWGEGKDEHGKCDAENIEKLHKLTLCLIKRMERVREETFFLCQYIFV